MFKSLKVLLVLWAVAMAAPAFSFQGLFHFEIGKQTWNMTKQFCMDIKHPEYESWALPLSGITTHLLSDGLVSEGYLGPWQVLRGMMKVGTVILFDDPKSRNEDVQIAFWNLLPDIIDKGFGVNFFHQYKPEQYLFTFDRESEEFAEDWVVFDMASNSFIIHSVPKGTLFALNLNLDNPGGTK